MPDSPLSLPGELDSGPVPVDGLPDHAWPSWREALTDAQAGIENAYDRRRRVFQAAFDAGLTLAEIAGVVGLSAQGVHKIIGKQRGPGDGSLLDSPAL
jgi:DNA-directed RNA polymerase specialized sigma24 family protein